jgi:hypothetical protein
MTALTLATAGAAEAAKRPTGCHPRAAKTVIQNRNVRVFWVHDRLYACRSGVRRALLLARVHEGCPGESSQGCDDVGNVRLAGRFVAVHRYEWHPGGSSASVDLVDTAKRKRVRRWSTPSADELFGEVTDMELSSRGVAAFIARTAHSAPGADWTYEVRTLGAQDDAVLDSGPDVEQGSLALARDGTLYWTRAGRVRSAALR